MAYGTRGLPMSRIRQWWEQRIRRPEREVQELPGSTIPESEEKAAAERLSDEWRADEAKESTDA